MLVAIFLGWYLSFKLSFWIIKFTFFANTDYKSYGTVTVLSLLLLSTLIIFHLWILIRKWKPHVLKMAALLLIFYYTISLILNIRHYFLIRNKIQQFTFADALENVVFDWIIPTNLIIICFCLCYSVLYRGMDGVIRKMLNNS